MWSQYDENLNENQFLRTIQTNHKDIIKKASEENWIICIPRSGVFELETSMDVILDHVLIHGMNDSYCTLSKKQLVLKNKHIYTDIIYQQCGSEVLFEETFYINKMSKYTVWCIDQPLFVKYKYCDSHKPRILDDLSDCIDFLWTESLGHALLNDIKSLVDKFLLEHQDLGTESLQTFKELIGALYSQCLQIGLRQDIIKEKTLNNTVLLDNFKLAVETYMHHCLGRNLIFTINTSQYQTDAYLNKIVRNSVDLDLDDLGISSKFVDTITIAKRELGKINNYFTVLDKIFCLKRTFNEIYKNGEVLNIQITSDIMLDLLVYLITKLNVNNWHSNIIFMKDFRLSLMENSDQTNFFITTVEAAIEYMKSNQFLEVKHNLSEDVSHSAVNLLYEKLLSGEIKSHVGFSLNCSLKSQSNLCHPLCHCEKCQQELDNEENDVKSQIIARKDDNLLLTASKLGYCEVVEYLLKKKQYNVNIRDCFNRTCLHYAATKGCQDILLLSIIYDANVNAVDNDRNTPLHLACMNGHDNCVKALIYSTPEVELNVGNAFGDTPLHLATKWGFLDIIKLLLENGASLLVENKQKQTVIPLSSNHYVLKLFQHFSSKNSAGFYKGLEQDIPPKEEKKIYKDYCKEHGVRPKDTEQYKKIDLLLRAIESNDFPLACFYLGFTTNCAEKSTTTECHPLCVCDNCNSDPDADCESQQNSPHSVNINMCNVNGYTPLHVAAKYGRTDILRLLLDSGGFPNVKTYKTLLTPLHLACMHKRVQIIRELLKCGTCKIDEGDAEGNTPLYYATINNDLKAVEILITNGADCMRKNYVDRNALQESEDKMFYRIFQVLKNSVTNTLGKYSYNKNVENDLF